MLLNDTFHPIDRGVRKLSETARGESVTCTPSGSLVNLAHLASLAFAARSPVPPAAGAGV